MSSLFTLIPPGQEEVSLDALEEAAVEEDILIDCLTDEELYWLRGDVGHADPTMDEPYLSSLAEEARSVAIDSGLRSLIAKGMIDLDPDHPENMEIVGPYALVGAMRNGSEAVTRLRLDGAGQPAVRYAFFRVSAALVLAEEVADDGFHDFSLQSPDSAASTLAALLDRGGRAGDVSESWERTTDRNLLTDRVERLAAESVHTALVESLGLNLRSEPYERLLTVYGTADGVWAFWGTHEDDTEQFVLGRLGAADLYGLAESLITGRL